MAIDWTLVGAGVIGLATSIGAYFKGQGARSVGAATDGAGIAVADAETALYNRLRERLDSLEGDVTTLRSELDTERRRGRALERHIWRLEVLMRKAGIEPPQLEDEPIRAGGTD